jgi:hypothetical protein
MASLVVFNVLLDRLGNGRIVGARRRRLDNNSLGDLTRRIVGNGDDSTVGHIGVGKEVSLELCGGNLESLSYTV